MAIPLRSELELMIALANLERHSKAVTFLSIELDSVTQELRLPQGKLARIQATIR